MYHTVSPFSLLHKTLVIRVFISKENRFEGMNVSRAKLWDPSKEIIAYRFFSEFTAHFGNTLRPFSGNIDAQSFEHVKRHTKKQQCKNNPIYCADFTANVAQVRSELEGLIDK